MGEEQAARAAAQSAPPAVTHLKNARPGAGPPSTTGTGTASTTARRRGGYQSDRGAVGVIHAGEKPYLPALGSCRVSPIPALLSQAHAGRVTFHGLRLQGFPPFLLIYASAWHHALVARKLSAPCTGLGRIFDHQHIQREVLFRTGHEYGPAYLSIKR